MSRQRHPQARLAGWNGPLYPEGIKEVIRADGLTDCDNGAEMADRLAKVRGYRGSRLAVRTSDGYGWYRIFEFRVGVLGHVALAMPWAQDFDRVGGTQLDRSPAMYTKGRRVRADAPDKIAALVARAWLPKRPG